MKTRISYLRSTLLATIFLVLCVSTGTVAQTTVIAEVRLMKVAAQNSAEFEKQMKEVWKPVNQMRKQNGRITNWQLYKIDFAGADDAYNYATVHFYNSMDKTEPNENALDLIKAALPKVDAVATLAKTRSLLSIVQYSLYQQVDFVQPKTPVPVKYIMVNFMKVREGMNDAYVQAEKNDWKPVHQALADEGKRAGWGLWALAYPGGTRNTHDYVAVDSYSTYAQISAPGVLETFRKVHPNQEVTPMIQRVEKARELVREQLWELIEMTN